MSGLSNITVTNQLGVSALRMQPHQRTFTQAAPTFLKPKHRAGFSAPSISSTRGKDMQVVGTHTTC